MIEKLPRKGDGLDMNKLSQVELQRILDAHKLWREDKGGKRANLRDADLSRADLSDANLSCADLSRADLSCANLRGADLSCADLDFSVWPLWCGGLHAKTDRRIMAQLAYHFCAQDCYDLDYIKARDAILWFANSFHRADECGELKPLGENR